MKLGIRRAGRFVSVIALLEYVLMALVLLYSSVWSLFTSANCNTFLRLGVPVIAVLILLRVREQGLPAMRWRRAAVLAAFLLVYLAFTRTNAVRFLLYYFLPLVLLTVYAGLLDERDGCYGLLYKLSDIVLAVAAVSLVFFLFGTCLGILPKQTVSFYWGEQNHTCFTYAHLYYESQTIHFFGHDLVRNCGLFAEAPGFAIFLVVAAAVELLLREHIRPMRCALLIVTSITTFSAKAILLVLLAAIFRFALTDTGHVTLRRLKRFLLPAVFAVGAAAAVVLLRDKMTSASFYIRTDDLQACLRTWLAHPLFGTGYWNDASVIPYFRYAARYNNGLSMGFTVLLAQGGVYLTVLYVLPIIQCFARTRSRERSHLTAFFITYSGLLFITNMPYSFLALCLLAISLEIRHGRGASRLAGRTVYADWQH